MTFKYVYILQSIQSPEHFYVGITDNLKARLARHNTGQVSATAENLAWRIKAAVAFTDGQQAAHFEKYLKTASGRAFAKKRL